MLIGHKTLIECVDNKAAIMNGATTYLNAKVYYVAR